MTLLEISEVKLPAGRAPAKKAAAAEKLPAAEAAPEPAAAEEAAE
jgi:hypothetical protein